MKLKQHLEYLNSIQDIVSILRDTVQNSINIGKIKTTFSFIRSITVDAEAYSCEEIPKV